jgi:hypothetical protein
LCIVRVCGLSMRPGELNSAARVLYVHAPVQL